MRVGRVTDALHQMSVGDTVGIRGPYGQAYPIEQFRGREILIVGGGCGVGPLRALLFALFEDLDNYPRILVRVGATLATRHGFPRCRLESMEQRRESGCVGFGRPRRRGLDRTGGRGDRHP